MWLCYYNVGIHFSNSDEIRFGLWLGEYVMVFLVLVIGLKAPALEVPDYTRMGNDAENSGNVSHSNGSSDVLVYL